MFEKNIQIAKESLLREINFTDKFIYLNEILANPSIHEAYKDYFRAEVAWWIYEKQAERKNSLNFDYSDAELNSIISRLDEKYFETARFDSATLFNIVETAVKVRANMVCRPRNTLRWFVFRLEKTKPFGEIIRRMNYLGDYHYLRAEFEKEARDSGVAAGDNSIVSIEFFSSLIEKIDDNHIYSLTPEEFPELIEPVFSFFNPDSDFGESRIVPIESLVIFLDDKNIFSLAEKLENLNKENNISTISKKYITDFIYNQLDLIDSELNAPARADAEYEADDLEKGSYGEQLTGFVEKPEPEAQGTEAADYGSSAIDIADYTVTQSMDTEAIFNSGISLGKETDVEEDTDSILLHEPLAAAGDLLPEPEEQTAESGIADFSKEFSETDSDLLSGLFTSDNEIHSELVDYEEMPIIQDSETFDLTEEKLALAELLLSGDESEGGETLTEQIPQEIDEDTPGDTGSGLPDDMPEDIDLDFEAIAAENMDNNIENDENAALAELLLSGDESEGGETLTEQIPQEIDEDTPGDTGSGLPDDMPEDIDLDFGALTDEIVEIDIVTEETDKVELTTSQLLDDETEEMNEDENFISAGNPYDEEILNIDIDDIIIPKVDNSDSETHSENGSETEIDELEIDFINELNDDLQSTADDIAAEGYPPDTADDILQEIEFESILSVSPPQSFGKSGAPIHGVKNDSDNVGYDMEFVDEDSMEIRGRIISILENFEAKNNSYQEELLNQLEELFKNTEMHEAGEEENNSLNIAVSDSEFSAIINNLNEPGQEQNTGANPPYTVFENLYGPDGGAGYFPPSAEQEVFYADNEQSADIIQGKNSDNLDTL